MPKDLSGKDLPERVRQLEELTYPDNLIVPDAHPAKVDGEVSAEAVSADRATLTDATRQEWGAHFEPTTVTNDENYASFPHLIEANNGDILAIYRSASEHLSTDGKAVYKRYSGGVWGSEQTIVDETGVDDRNLSVGKDPSTGDLIVVYRTTDGDANTQDVLVVTSSDNGETWSLPNSIIGELSGSAGNNTNIPFGDIIPTSNGLLQAFYGGGNNTELLFSTDAGDTWGNIVDTGFAMTEPAPTRIDEDRLLLVGRNASGYEYAKSSDGGSTWSGKTTVQADVGGVGVPVWAKQVTGGTIATVVGDRNRGEIRVYYAPVEEVWQQPETLLRGSGDVVGVATGTGGIDFGYPVISNVGGVDTITWYDGGEFDTDIYAASAPTRQPIGSSVNITRPTTAVTATARAFKLKWVTVTVPANSTASLFDESGLAGLVTIVRQDADLFAEFQLREGGPSTEITDVDGVFGDAAGQSNYNVFHDGSEYVVENTGSSEFSFEVVGWMK